MKRIVALVCVWLCLISFGGCRKNETFGVTLIAKDVTPTGMTMIFKQSGFHINGILMSGAYYRLEKLEDQQWVPLKRNPEADGWTAEGWAIFENDSMDREVNWKDLYGTLPPGRYRIIKGLSYVPDAGETQESECAVEFSIEE